MNSSYQKGVGLVEVIIALLLLSIGVLGFAMLQMRAMDASMDASKRIQAMNLARDLSERMRANKLGLLKNIAVEDDETEKLVDAYSNALEGQYSSSSYEATCSKNDCSSIEFAQEDANQVLYKAYKAGMKIALNNCPGVEMESPRYCVYVAWKETLPVDGGNLDTSCTNNGSFNNKSNCIVLETY
jgi:type IV pilus assembly protein PilV